MSQPINTNLELASTDDLIEELSRRHTAFFCGGYPNSHASPEDGTAFRLRWSGDMIRCLGLLSVITYLITKVVAGTIQGG